MLLREHSVRADSIAFSHTLDSFATANTTGQPRDSAEIKIVDMATGRARLTFAYTDEEVHTQTISFSRDGRLLIAGGGRSQHCGSTVWDIGGQMARKIGSYPVEPEVSHNGRLLAVGSESRATLVEATTGRERGELMRAGDVTRSSFYYNGRKSYPSATFSPDGRIVVVWRIYGDSRTTRLRRIARVWRVESLTELCTSEPCDDVMFSPDNRALVMLAWNGTLKLRHIHQSN